MLSTNDCNLGKEYFKRFFGYLENNHVDSCSVDYIAAKKEILDNFNIYKKSESSLFDAISASLNMTCFRPPITLDLVIAAIAAANKISVPQFALV